MNALLHRFARRAILPVFSSLSLFISLALAPIAAVHAADIGVSAQTDAAKATAPSTQAPAGSLVIIGGALRGDNGDVWPRIVALAGGPGARIAIFPSAAGNPERSGQNAAAMLRRYGAEPFVAPVAVKLAGSDYRQSADDGALAAQVRAAGGVYFVGGDQGRITQALLHADGTRTAVLDAIWDMYRRGGVIAGTSAGAAVMSSTMFNDVPPVLAAMRGDMRDGRELAPGLGFIGDQVFIDQHFLVRGRFARMLPAMLKKGYRLGIGIDENSALVVQGGHALEVIGYKGALLMDLSHASSDPKLGAFNVNNAVLSYLDHGDRYDLNTSTHVPGPDKQGGLLDRAHPSQRGPLYSNDILGNTAVVDLMEQLVDSDQQEALGIASGDPRSSTPETGFAFRFSRTGDTKGYESSVASAYSIMNVRLDVKPVDVVRPAIKFR